MCNAAREVERNNLATSRMATSGISSVIDLSAKLIGVSHVV